jgi:hypothetical protein
MPVHSSPYKKKIIQGGLFQNLGNGINNQTDALVQITHNHQNQDLYLQITITG